MVTMPALVLQPGIKTRRQTEEDEGENVNVYRGHYEHTVRDRAGDEVNAYRAHYE